MMHCAYSLTSLSLSSFQFGFFRRKKHEEIKRQREEIQNLTAHGVSPGDLGSDPEGPQTAQL